MTTVKVALPASEASVSIDTTQLPENVRNRLVEIGLTTHIRSAVNSAYSTELEKAMKADRSPLEEAFNAEQKALKEADAKYKVKKFAYDAKAFKEAFTHETDAEEVANARIEDLMAGNIRAARGGSGANKALLSLVKANILAVLKSKGKPHRDALAMIGDDPMAFIDKTARKRAGDDAEAYKTELAKLNAQYVEPARAMLSEPEDDVEGDTDGEESNDPNDLL